MAVFHHAFQLFRFLLRGSSSKASSRGEFEPQKLLTKKRVNESITTPDDQQHLFPILYVHDYLGDIAEYISIPPVNLSQDLESGRFLQNDKLVQDQKKRPTRSENAIDLFPLAAGIPWPSGVYPVRQSKHWKAAVETTRELLELCVAETHHPEVSEVARKELHNFEENWMKFSAYMFPEASEEQIKLIAASMTYVFVFDDFWEACDDQGFSPIYQDYISRMVPGWNGDKTHRTPLQATIDQMVEGFYEQDRINGNNCGLEVIQGIVQLFNHHRPPQKYHGMEEFLQYRSEDAGLPYVLACSKLSIGNTADFNSPQLANFVWLVKSQMPVANDLSSWAKERKAYDAGKIRDMINSVEVTKRLFSLPHERASFAVTYAFQLEIERELDAEIERLRVNNILTAEEWRFVDVVLYLVTGGFLVNIIASRYGGEKAKLL